MRSFLFLIAAVAAWVAWVQAIRPLAAGYYPFEDVTESSGIRFRHPGVVHPINLDDTGGPGVSWADYDGDGYPDLLMHQGFDRRGRSELYRNRGDGTFEDVTDESGAYLQGSGGGGAIFLDTRNNGEMDLALSHAGSTWLAENQGDGTFVVRRMGAGEANAAPASMAAGDFDNDGFVDLFVDNYITLDRSKSSRTYAEALRLLIPSLYQGARKHLWRNLGGGRFEDVTPRAGVANAEGRSLGVVFSDLQNRGRPDIFITNDLNANVLYSNRGDGTFDNIALSANIASSRSGMGIAVGDYDNDGAMDIFVTHFTSQHNALFHNDIGRGGRLRFTDVADAAGVGLPSKDLVGWGAMFLDVDGDGRLDLFVVSGHVLPDESMHLIPYHPQLFMQTTPGHFDEVCAGQGPFALDICGRGLAVADYDRDGRPDLAFVGIGAPGRLWRNVNAEGCNWLDVELRGRAGASGATARDDGTRTSNAAGVGGRIYVQSGDHRQMCDVMAGGSIFAESSLVQNFGLGLSKEVDKLEVRWPGGAVQTFEGLPPNRHYVIREPD